MNGPAKARPNHREYLRVLRRMMPAQRLRKAFELSDYARSLFLHGLRRRFGHVEEAELKRILLDRLEKCHNRNY